MMLQLDKNGSFDSQSKSFLSESDFLGGFAMAEEVATVRRFILSTIGKKYVVGITGLIWVGFILAHMVGNTLIFISPDAYNKYGHTMTSGYFIYVAEGILVISLLIHIFFAVLLTRENRIARGGQRYAVNPNGEKGSSLAAKTMIFHGTIILFFIISHLKTFKFGTYYQTSNGEIRDLHRLLVEVFKQPAYVAWYVVCLILLGTHLSHGVISVFQSLGIFVEKYSKCIHWFGWIYTAIVILGFLSQPIYVLFTN